MTARSLVLAPLACEDVAEIRQYTLETYGERGLAAYDALMRRALEDVQGDPFRAGSRDRADDLDAEGVRTYHTAHSRSRATPRVARPRHILVYRLPDDRRIEILRILHDSRDLARHLPDEAAP